MTISFPKNRVIEENFTSAYNMSTNGKPVDKLVDALIVAHPNSQQEFAGLVEKRIANALPQARPFMKALYAKVGGAGTLGAILAAFAVVGTYFTTKPSISQEWQA